MSVSKERMLKALDEYLDSTVMTLMLGLEYEEFVQRIHDIVAPDKNPTLMQMMVTALCDVMGKLPELSGAEVGQLASKILKLQVTPEFIQENYGEDGPFYLHDWRGQRGDKPNATSIAATLKAAMDGWPVAKPVNYNSRQYKQGPAPSGMKGSKI